MNILEDRDLLMQIIDEIFEEGDRSHKEEGASMLEYRQGLNFATKVIDKYREKYWNKNLINQ
jgi:hypothetical protein